MLAPLIPLPARTRTRTAYHPCSLSPAQVVDDSVKEAYTTMQFHPDGLILGTGVFQGVVIERELDT